MNTDINKDMSVHGDLGEGVLLLMDGLRTLLVVTAADSAESGALGYGEALV
jgi:hypothetical protein